MQLSSIRENLIAFCLILWDDFNKPKILYSEIVTQPQFYLDATGNFVPEATSFVMTGLNLDILIKYLNSRVVSWIFKSYYAGGGLGNGFRYKKAFIEHLCIPQTLLQKTLDTKIENEILLIYGFDENERNYITSRI